jgi:hypothetical protein
MRLTLTSPDDLKVRESDIVVIGQIIADRVRDRTRLEFQKDSLLAEITRLKQLQALPIPEIKPLPSANFLEESADIERLRFQAENMLRDKEQQQRKLDVLRTLPQSELPEAIIPHEELVLGEKEREYNQAIAEVNLAQGKLSKSQQKRQIDEYNHSLEKSKLAIAQREQELQQQGQIADLAARLSQIEISLSQLSAVRSPYSGSIQKIKFEGQNDQNLTVELILVINRNSRPSAIPTPSPSPRSSPNGNPGTPGE